ncbi:alpha/beta hydrolase [Phenylobacterium sp.]|uniref:alpha/beta hydrolase n=1 Tax=Phenylobacterium sp. TaxID=1871053 RepID=UPI00301C0731
MTSDVDEHLARLRAAPQPPMTLKALPAIRRRFAAALAAGYPPRPLADVAEAQASPGASGPRVRTYTPGGSGGSPVILFFHGGGFVLGSLDSHDGLCRDLALRTGWRVVAVDYRLAPEAPHPAALDDALAAYDALPALTDGCGPVVVMGDSAGGWLAAQVALRRPAALQVLLYPALDLSCGGASHAEFGTGYGLESPAIAFCYDCFAPTGPREDGELSPALRTDLGHAPPALLLVGGRDPLRDEAIAYAGRLAAAGVDVQLRVVAGMIHGFMTAPLVFARAAPELERLVDDMSRALAVPLLTPTVGVRDATVPLGS